MHMHMASLDEGNSDHNGEEEDDNMDEYNDDYFHSQDQPLPNQSLQSLRYPESVRSNNFHDESAADDDTLYTSTSAKSQDMDMDSYFHDTVVATTPSSPSNIATAATATATTTTTTTDRNGKRMTSTTTTVRIPPPTSPPNGRQGSAPPVSPSKSYVSTTTTTAALPTVPIATNHDEQHQINNSLPPLRCDETRHLVKQFIAAIWNRGELEIIPDVCSPSLRFNGNTGTYVYVLENDTCCVPSEGIWV
jgi:hypothetical protein